MKKLLLVLLLSFGVHRALVAQVQINFSGGSGSPLTFTLPTAVTFTRTAPDTKSQLFFIIPSLTTTNGSSNTTGSTFTAQINAAAPSAWTDIQMSAGSWFQFGSGLSFPTTTGDTVILSAGSFTTTSSLAGSFSSGLYNIYLMDSSTGGVESAAGVSAVPEPSTYAAIAGALALGGTILARRRRAA